MLPACDVGVGGTAVSGVIGSAPVASSPFLKSCPGEGPTKWVELGSNLSRLGFQKYDQMANRSDRGDEEKHPNLWFQPKDHQPAAFGSRNGVMSRQIGTRESYQVRQHSARVHAGKPHGSLWQSSLAKNLPMKIPSKLDDFP